MTTAGSASRAFPWEGMTNCAAIRAATSAFVVEAACTSTTSITTAFTRETLRGPRRGGPRRIPSHPSRIRMSRTKTRRESRKSRQVCEFHARLAPRSRSSTLGSPHGRQFRARRRHRRVPARHARNRRQRAHEHSRGKTAFRCRDTRFAIACDLRPAWRGRRHLRRGRRVAVCPVQLEPAQSTAAGFTSCAVVADAFCETAPNEACRAGSASAGAPRATRCR